MAEKIIHFGEFIRWNRVKAGRTTDDFGRAVGLTARRLIAIEAMATPDIQATTKACLANAMGIEVESFDQVWQSTPVPVTRRKPGPTTELASRFNTVCAENNVAPAEAMKRLRSWIITQPPAVQRDALSGNARPTTATFSAVVDHSQDPVDSTRQRIATAAFANHKP